MAGVRKDEVTIAVEVVADAGVADLQKLLENLDRTIDRILRRLGVDDDDRVLPRAQLGNLTTVRRQVVEAIEKAGGRAVGVLDRRMLQAAQRAASLSDIPDEFLPDAQRAIAQIQDGRTREITRMFTAEVDAVIAAINAGIVGSVPIDRLVADVAARTGAAVSKTQALIDTAIMAAGRSVVVDGVAAINNGRDEPVLLLRYVGPLDTKTRPFCRRILGAGAVYTPEAVAALDNGQGLPVTTSCGGWRCRHSWAATTAENARGRGWRIIGA